VSVRRKLFGGVQIAFSTFVFLGSVFEVTNLLVPTFFPSLQNNPIMAMHHSQPVVFWWTLLSNLTTACLAIVLFASAIGLLRQHRASSRMSILAIKVFLLVLGGATCVSVVYLLPQQLAMLQSSSRALGLIMIISMTSAIFGLAVSLGVLWIVHANILRRASAA